MCYILFFLKKINILKQKFFFKRFKHLDMNIKNFSRDKNQTFKGSVFEKPLGVFYNPNAVIPTLAIEAGVTLGRSFEANKRGGKKEATERFVEQGLSAVIWLWGVQAIKKTNDFLSKKLFKLNNQDFDIGFDEVRNPVKNNNISKKLVAYKTSNILFSTALATFFIGFILPKINHKISSKVNKEERKKDIKTFNIPSFDEFRKNKKGKNLSFTSVFSNKAYKLAHTLENNSTARLLITDTGVISGRYYNSRNKYEKIESLFRDISSIYFYLFSAKHFKRLLNNLSKNTDINPKALENTVLMLNKNLGQAKLLPDEFLDSAVKNLKKEDLKKIDMLFKNRKTINLEEFIKNFPMYEKEGLKMSELQPVFNQKRILTKMQAKDILSPGWVFDAEFLNNVFKNVTNGASADKKRFVANKSLESLRISIEKFAKQIADYSFKNDVLVDKKVIRKVADKNIRKNFIYNIFATFVSIYALGILIPKVQYFITKKLTNEDKFPGEDDFLKK